MGFWRRLFSNSNDRDEELEDYEFEDNVTDYNEKISLINNVECVICGEILPKEFSTKSIDGDSYLCEEHENYQPCHCGQYFPEDELYLGFCGSCAESEFRHDQDAWDLAENMQDKMFDN